jgi:hypothetical protein
MMLLPIISLGVLILSLVGVLVSLQYFTHYQGMMLLERAHIADQQRRMRTSLMVLMAFSLVAVTSVCGILYPALGGFSPTPAPPLPTGTATSSLTALPGETPGAPTVLPATETPTGPTPTPPDVLPTALIGNTGGAGANVRAKPGLGGPVIEVLSEGTRVYLFDDIREVDGYTWQKIEMPDTRDGWVVVQFLIPEN